jgi:predicted nucleotidyltransferase
MDRQASMKSVKKDFLFMKDEVLGIVVYGSFARGEKFSDVDVCIVIGKEASIKEMKDMLKRVWRNVNINKANYDVKLFEELPLSIKIEVIKEGKVIIGNKLDIYEYFYKFRKLWGDQKHRQMV